MIIDRQLLVEMAEEADSEGVSFRWERLQAADDHDYQHDFRHAAREVLGQKDIDYSWGTRIVGSYLCMILTTE